MANFSINNKEVLDTVNYIISGPFSIGQDQQGVGESDGVYFTNNISPWVSPTIPSPAPAQNVWIQTDCFAIVNIDTPDQKVAVGSQLRGFISLNVTTAPANLLVNTAIVRFTGNTVPDPQAGTVLAYTTTQLFYGSTGVRTDDGDFGNQIIVAYIDQPGLEDVNGEYTYWLMFKTNTIDGNITVTDVGADVRNLTATKLKS